MNFNFSSNSACKHTVSLAWSAHKDAPGYLSWLPAVRDH